MLLCDLASDCLSLVTQRLNGHQLIKLWRIGDSRLNSKLFGDAVAHFEVQYDGTPKLSVKLPFARLSSISLRLRVGFCEWSLLVQSLKPTLRHVTLNCSKSFEHFAALLYTAYPNCLLPNLESLMLRDVPRNESLKMLCSLPKLVELNLQNVALLEPRLLPLTLTKLTVTGDTLRWDEKAKYSGLPGDLEALSIAFGRGLVHPPEWPPCLTCLEFFYTELFYTAYSQIELVTSVEETQRLPRALKELIISVAQHELTQILSVLPPTLERLGFRSSTFVSPEHYMHLPRTLKTLDPRGHNRETMTSEHLKCLPPTMKHLLTNMPTIGALVGDLPRSLTDVYIIGPFDAPLPPSLLYLKVMQLENPIVGVPLLQSLNLSNLTSIEHLKNLPSTLTSLTVTSTTALDCCFFEYLPHKLTEFTGACRNAIVSASQLASLPKYLLSLELTVDTIPDPETWSQLPKHLKKININAQLAEGSKPAELALDKFVWLEELVLTIQGSCFGLGDRIASRLPPRLQILMYANNRAPPRDLLSDKSRAKLTKSLQKCVLPSPPLQQK